MATESIFLPHQILLLLFLASKESKFFAFPVVAVAGMAPERVVVVVAVWFSNLPRGTCAWGSTALL
jgi:hypothetical protein